MAANSRDLRERDLRAGLAMVRLLAAEDIDCGGFIRRVLNELPAIVPSDLTTLSFCDLRRGQRTVVCREGEALSEADRAAFDRHFADHPLVRFHATHLNGPTQRVSDCESIADFRDSAVYCDYYRRIGIDHVMALPLRIDEANLFSVVFNRGRSNFTDRERAVADSVRGPLAALYRNFAARDEARAGLTRLERLALGGGWRLLRVTDAGRIVEASAPAVRLLADFFPADAIGRGAALPDAMTAWIGRSRNWGLDRTAPSAGEAFELSRGPRKLTVHFIPDARAAGRGSLLLKEERRTLGPEHLAALPLSPREREVLALVALGRTNGEIGTILGISPRTVQKHLEHLFQKLGVETRTGAAVFALAAAGRNEGTA
jgi:DNA-binding CsgD family transcriptional regulator